jgi:protease-4
MENTRSSAWPWLLFGGLAFVVLVMAVIVLATVATSRHHRGGFGDKIGVVDLEGVIIEPDTVVRELKDFGDDDSIKAIILHINTPGGGAAASQEIYSEVKRLRDEKKKTIVSDVQTLGASGGYYVASGTDKIYANPASIVGSIGVISEWVNYEDLLKWAKLKDVTFKAGALKDAGNPAREMTPEEKAYFQSLIDDMHQQFIHAVADGRHLKVDDVQKIADGRVWTGQQALPLKLVDKLGDFEMAVKETAQSVGIKGEPELVRPEREKKTLLDLLLGDTDSALDSLTAKFMDRHPGFYFLWK